MFSNKDLADFINSAFEPAWEKVSSLPYYDYGEKGTRRLAAGNTATVICSKDATVMNVLPSIYTRSHYRWALEQSRLLCRFTSAYSVEQRTAFLAWYHQKMAKAGARPQGYPAYWAPTFEPKRGFQGQPSSVLLRNTWGVPDFARTQTQRYRPNYKTIKSLEKDPIAIHANPEEAVPDKPIKRPSYNYRYDWRNQYVHFLKPVHEMLAKQAGEKKTKRFTERLFKEKLHIHFMDHLCLAKYTEEQMAQMGMVSEDAQAKSIENSNRSLDQMEDAK